MGEELRHSYVVHYILLVGDLLINPLSNVIDYFSPLAERIRPDGSVSWEVSFFRATLIDFLDVLFYVIMGALIGFNLQNVPDNVKSVSKSWLFIR